MSISYNKLWKLLIDKGTNKTKVRAGDERLSDCKVQCGSVSQKRGAGEAGRKTKKERGDSVTLRGILSGWPGGVPLFFAFCANCI